MTTNHPEKLDHALLRIGRIDMIIQINLPSKIHIEKLFIDIMKNRIAETDVKSNFEEFYDYIKNKKITMSSIVNFLFRYRESWKENINEIIDTDNFIKDTLKERSDTGFYT
jgi:SpoVK/Ycf46/Vps4 family AAA+-type ATPase